jgi:hypothetical protein
MLRFVSNVVQRILFRNDYGEKNSSNINHIQKKDIFSNKK